jgi:predicted amidohydrolase YtcJ
MIYYRLTWLVGIHLFLIFISCSSSNSKNDADLILTNGIVWTGNSESPNAEAVAIKGSAILAVGSMIEIDQLKNPDTKVIDLEGQFVTPGFIDCHVHFISGGFQLSSVQLRDAGTREDFIQRMKDFAQNLQPGEWITGGDWDHENWGGILPDRSWIDSVTLNNPVWISRLDGHMALANTAALQVAGVSHEVQSPFGGTVVKDHDGRPTGIFKDNAMGIIWRHIPEPSSKQVDNAVDEGYRHLLSNGVTSMHHVSGNIDAFEKAKREGRLLVRTYIATPLPDWKDLSVRVERNGTGDHWLKIGAVKGFVDGSLGSHTAAFFDPFTDTHNDSGFFVHEVIDLYNWISASDSAGLQVMVHAIGDSAIHEILDIYERIIMENGKKDRRFRIEHAQHIDPKDIPRFKELDVIPSMQPYHAIDDGRWAEKVIGQERARTTYAFRSLLDGGARIAFGSDWTVAPATPLEGIYAAVTRRTLDGKNPGGWIPEQKIAVEEALRAYTIEAAYASFEEDLKGQIKPGMLADLTIIDKNLLDLSPEKIWEAIVEMTIVGGRIAFIRKE